MKNHNKINFEIQSLQTNTDKTFMPQRYRIKKKEDVYQMLKKKRNFEFMSDRLLQQLVDNMSVFRFKKGENILIQGKRTKAFFILITGNASVFVDNKFLYNLTRTGDVIGELSFITQNTCSATIKASKDTGVVAITRELLKKVNKVEFFLWLCRILGDKLVRTSKIKTGTLDSNSDPKEAKKVEKKAPPPEALEDDLDMVDKIANISPDEITSDEDTTEPGIQQISDVTPEMETETSVEENPAEIENKASELEAEKTVAETDQKSELGQEDANSNSKDIEDETVPESENTEDE